MRKGDVSGGLNEAKVLYCCSKTEFSHFEKRWENCKRRASPPHPKTLAISVKTIFVQVVGFCVWPIHCATLASPWRSFRWNALFCWVPCFFLLPLGSFSQVGAACVLQSTFFLQRIRTESGRKNIPKTLKYNRKWVPKSMPGRPKIDKIPSLRFRSV